MSWICFLPRRAAVSIGCALLHLPWLFSFPAGIAEYARRLVAGIFASHCRDFLVQVKWRRGKGCSLQQEPVIFPANRLPPMELSTPIELPN